VSDTVNHALFGWPYWSGHKEDLEVQLGRLLSFADRMAIVCGPTFENLPVNPEHKETILRGAEETFRIFYKMLEDIMTVRRIR